MKYIAVGNRAHIRIIEIYIYIYICIYICSFVVKLRREFRAESCVVEEFQVDTGRLVYGSLELKVLKLFSL